MVGRGEASGMGVDEGGEGGRRWAMGAAWCTPSSGGRTDRTHGSRGGPGSSRHCGVVGEPSSESSFLSGNR
jgi:hypothetical protein